VSIGPLDLFPASDLAATIKGPGITVSNITFKGSGQTAGFFTGGMDAVGLDAGIILSTGLASCVTALNSAVNCDSHLSLPGDADLTALAGGVATYDATALEFDFVPTFSNVSLRYVFASEEYNQWVGQFNDLFALYLDGVNVATLPDGTVVSINNVNACVNPGYYVNNIDQATGLCSAMPPSAGRPTAMNGMTQVLSIAVTLTPDITHHLKLVIADTKDDQLDSNLFIGLGSLKCGPP
jgi:hypothetical protein